jgi:hypothetical protein
MRKLVLALIGAAIGVGLAVGFVALAGKPLSAGFQLEGVFALIGAVIGFGASIVAGPKPGGDNAGDSFGFTNSDGHHGGGGHDGGGHH